MAFAWRTDLIEGLSGGTVVEDEEIIIGDRKDVVYIYEDESGELIRSFDRAFQKWDEMAAGDVNGDGKAEIVHADRSGDKIYVYSLYGLILSRKSTNFEVGDDIAVGDLNGDGRAEIVHADRNNWIKIYDGNIDLINSFKVEQFADGDSIAIGDLNGDGRGELIHADDSENLVTVYDMYGNALLSFSTDDYFDLKPRDEMATGDLNLDGVDEIVIATQDTANRGIHVFYADLGRGKAGEIAKFTMAFKKGDRIAVGDVNTDVAEEIVWASQSGKVRVFNIGGDLLNGPEGFDTKFTYGAGLAVGDLDGNSIEVGTPTRGALYVEKKLIAVVNSPPVDYEVINETGLFYSQYRTTTSNTVKGSVKSISDATLSTGLSLKGGIVGLSLEANLDFTVQQTLEREKGESFTEEISYEITADMSDGALYVTTAYDVYEYPIIGPPELAVIDGEQQYILVTVPRGPPVVSFLEYESPIHRVGDITTYPSRPENLVGYDVNTLLGSFTMEAGEVGKRYERLMRQLNWEKKSNSFKATISAGLVASGGAFVEATQYVKGSYSTGSVATHEVSFSNETKIVVEYRGRISEPEKRYTVTGYIYRDVEEGHLVLDYVVSDMGDYYWNRKWSPILIDLGLFTITYDLFLSMNTPPECSLTATPESGQFPLEVEFNIGMNDTDSELRWVMNFGDGEEIEGNGTTARHTYTSEGLYIPSLTVYDPWGANSSCIASVNVQYNEEPSVGFTHTPEEPKAGGSVSFTSSANDPDGGIVEWLWDFGDGSSSKERNPSHVYELPGVYTATLTVTDSGGLKAVFSRTITVRPENEPPTADFTFSPENPLTEQEITFRDESSDPDGSIVGWSWDFGDGSSSTDKNPVHAYAGEGNYTVTLTVRDNKGAEDTVKMAVLVEKAPETATSTETESPTETEKEEPSQTPTPSSTGTLKESKTPEPEASQPTSTTEGSPTCGIGLIAGFAILPLLLWRRRSH
ncbi:PKD domain-containing protein [Palaeococcus ferrophilus]|uniref:PKD domain-containing protein n=1 Tax=Palaeococcus ferrophilus TaxID=83868 RepID=UPI0006962AA7|nr:PKD domain-containing protein [Palaeococcus ferrophilus]